MCHHLRYSFLDQLVCSYISLIFHFSHVLCHILKYLDLPFSLKVLAPKVTDPKLQPGISRPGLQFLVPSGTIPLSLNGAATRGSGTDTNRV